MGAIATIIGDVFAAVFKGFFGLFAKTPEEKLGIEETENASSKKTVTALETVIAVDDRVDGSVPSDGLCDKLNARPK